MSVSRPGSSRYRSLHASRRALARAAPLLRFGLFAVGVSVFLDQVRPLVSDAQFTWGERRVMAVVAIVTLGGFALAGWLAGRLIGAIAELMEVLADGAEAAVEASFLLETQVVPALVRAATALERLAEPATGDAAPATTSRAAAAVRQAIQSRRWGRAAQLLQALRSDDPAVSLLTAELAEARQSEVEDLRARLDAARAAGDAEQVIACRDTLTQHLRGDALHDLDDRVVRWLAQLIASRVQAGQVSPELAALAERVADSFGDTAEGAALQAALPKLRRRAGLCPACARPYKGQTDTCPDCRTAQTAPRPRGANPGGKP